MSSKVTLLDKVTNFIEQKIAPPLVKLSQAKYLEALQRTFMTLMPFMILGATSTLILNLGGLFAEGTGLNMQSVADAINAVVGPLRPGLLQIVFVSINIIALSTAILNGYFLSDYYNKKNSKVTAIVGAILSGVAFLCFVNFAELSANFDWPSYIMGSPSLFGGILISIVAVEIYQWLVNKNITIKMPDSVPPMIASAFVSIIPVSVVVIIAALLGQGIAGFDFLTIINQLFSHLVVGGSGPVAQFIGFFLDRLLWFVGLHGSNIVSSVMQPIWATMGAENVNAFAQQAAIPYMFTDQWINVYVRVSVFPIAVLCMTSKVKRFKVLGRLSLPGTIFNIAEPIMFGLPIVLNPLMFVPWVLGFSALFIFNAILGLLSITPPMVAMTVWTMPAPLSAFIGSGFNIVALLISLASFVIVFLIFLPFFRIMERQELEKEKQYEQEQHTN